MAVALRASSFVEPVDEGGAVAAIALLRCRRGTGDGDGAEGEWRGLVRKCSDEVGKRDGDRDAELKLHAAKFCAGPTLPEHPEKATLPVCALPSGAHLSAATHEPTTRACKRAPAPTPSFPTSTSAAC